MGAAFLLGDFRLELPRNGVRRRSAGPSASSLLCNDSGRDDNSFHLSLKLRFLLMLKRWRIRIFLFLAVLGPGFITANVDNDPNGIFTYSQAGARFGYALLWTIIPITIALVVVQEMCARMGVVTGKGLSDLIREEFGLRVTVVVMFLLVVVNFGNIIGEFAGAASSLELFHLSKYISVPIVAVLVWLLAVRGDYKKVEKVFLAGSLFYFAYIIAGVLSEPNWHTALKATVTLPSR